MKTRFIEATQANEPFNWGKFLITAFEQEDWQYISPIAEKPLLTQIGYDTLRPVLSIMDLQTGEGGVYILGGNATLDLNKKPIWVCPLYEPFLGWLYHEYPTTYHANLDELPNIIHLTNAPAALAGYRRPGKRKASNHESRR